MFIEQSKVYTAIKSFVEREQRAEDIESFQN